MSAVEMAGRPGWGGAVGVGAGILGALGWFIGAAVPLLQTPGPTPADELRLRVSEDELPYVEGELVDAGTIEVLVTGNGQARLQ
ncbi:MAG: hypothetical protein L0332_18415 [Chloroflexi bacterium]|nr:hypothetical protein [Chloroflexota bacterium]MCI0643445.1 hypothetical protein [Chloroflexota bacterium]MCI0728675.1 hypothetical protein [Chloroflexota bacterium]